MSRITGSVSYLNKANLANGDRSPIFLAPTIWTWSMGSLRIYVWCVMPDGKQYDWKSSPTGSGFVKVDVCIMSQGVLWVNFLKCYQYYTTARCPISVSLEYVLVYAHAHCATFDLWRWVILLKSREESLCPGESVHFWHFLPLLHYIHKLTVRPP